MCETAFGVVPIMSHASILVHGDKMTSQQLVFLAQLTLLKATAYVTACGPCCVRLFGVPAERCKTAPCAPLGLPTGM